MLLAMFASAESRRVQQYVRVVTDPDLNSAMDILLTEMAGNPKLHEEIRAVNGEVLAMMTDPLLWEQAVLVAEQLQKMKVDANFQEQAKQVLEQAKEVVTQMQPMMTDPRLQGKAEEATEEIMDNLTLAEHAGRLFKQLKAMRANELMDQLMETLVGDANFQRHARRIAAHVEAIRDHLISQETDGGPTVDSFSLAEVNRSGLEVSFVPPSLLAGKGAPQLGIPKGAPTHLGSLMHGITTKRHQSLAVSGSRLSQQSRTRSHIPVASRVADIGYEVDTLLFDIDDTLYASSCGLSEHRMGNVTKRFMVEQLGFQSENEAFELWMEYIKRYHSTLKGLAVATKEGRLPKPFREEDLGKYWAEQCDFASYIGPDYDLINALEDLQNAGMKLVAFTNAPRLYGLRVLEVLGVRRFFLDNRIFGVEDVMPACKPEPQAFQRVLSSVGSQSNRTVMFEDSMKNIRACRSMGIHTVLVQEDVTRVAGEAELVGDAPEPEDPSVGAVLQRAGDVVTALPGLLHGRFQGTYRDR